MGIKIKWWGLFIERGERESEREVNFEREGERNRVIILKRGRGMVGLIH